MKIEHRDWSEDDTLAIVGAGVSWDAFVADAVAHGRHGVENLSGIPGSIGGAAVGNIGAYGNEVRDTILWVEALDPSDLRVVRFDNFACRFGYRHSLFKEEEGKRFIVTSVAFRLSKDAPLNREYKDIAAYEEENGTIGTLDGMRAAILAIRARKFPKEGTVGNAGSFFKNPVVTPTVAARFLEKFPDAPVHDTEDGMKKLSAAWIIDRVLKMRGTRDGEVGTWESQALVLINHGDAKASDVARFAKRISQACEEETGVTLSPEVVFIGDIESE
jgi:UDP-N-acetylmuramate dehydrogenase